VAAPASLAGELDRVVTAADEAAAAIARFVRWTQPTRYVICLAGPDEWGRWYGPLDRTEVLGIAVQVGQTASPVVLNYTAIEPGELSYVLRHELGHVNTLLGARYPGLRDVLVEGIAEYMPTTDGPSRSMAVWMTCGGSASRLGR
jgi:hypothetical protein